MEFRCYYVHNRRYKCYMLYNYVLPVHGRHFDFRYGFLSYFFCYRRQLCCLEKHDTDHCIAYQWSFTLVDMMMPVSFRNLYEIVSTDICCRGRHRVTNGNFVMGKPPTCADCVPRGIGESASLNSYGNQSYSRKTEAVETLTPLLSDG